MGRGSQRRWWDGLAALFAVAALMPWPLLAGPDNWWAFVLVTAAILIVLRLLFGPQWRSRAGLDLSPVQILFVIMVFALIAMGSGMLLHNVYATAGLRANPLGIEEHAGFLFQAFNEEVFFRALMIGALIPYVRSPVLISLGLALIFPVAHFFLYRYSNPMHLALSIPALVTLFAAGVAWNNLYLAFRHIGFSWALHAGWNVVWLPTAFYDAATHAPLHEPQIFDRVLGAPPVALLACAIAVLSFAFLARRPPGSPAKLSNVAG